MDLILNRVERKSLKPGDHIYTWRRAHIYAHHGIYVGDDTVIHFIRQARQGQERETGTVLDAIAKAKAQVRCSNCPPPEKGHHGVVSSCLNCFLEGDSLNRYMYAVPCAIPARYGTFIQARSDPDAIVVHRANHLLEKGFGPYDLFTNNCEDFAIYCKTGSLALDQHGRSMGQSGQATIFHVVVSLTGGLQQNKIDSENRFKNLTFVFEILVKAFKIYVCNRKDVIKVPVEEWTKRLAAMYTAGC